MPKKSGSPSNGNEVGTIGNGSEIAGEDKLQPIIIDPADVADPAGGTETGGNDNPPARKRGRPKGSGNGSGRKTGKKASETLDIDGLSAIFLSTHSMLAVLTKTQELAIDKTEAETLATGVANVARHYDIGRASQKTLDWFNLIQALALVYGTRLYAVRGKFRKKPKVQNPAETTPKQPDIMNGGFVLDQYGNILQ